MGEIIVVTGGAGYVGGRLVPRLLREGYSVRVVDNLTYGRDGLARWSDHPALTIHRADIRDTDAMRTAMCGASAVIHLAAIANDPSAELDPQITVEVNYEASVQLAAIAARAHVRRFVYASSASVYGIVRGRPSQEDDEKHPVSVYGETKLQAESAILNMSSSSCTTTSLRCATLCGYSPRQRLDLTMNILTYDAWRLSEITVLGGAQIRPQLHVDDAARAYIALLTAPATAVAGLPFNLCRLNLSVADAAEVVRRTLPWPISVCVQPTNDPRSYALAASRIRRAIGFKPRYPIAAAVLELAQALLRGEIPDPESPIHRNVAWLREMVEAVPA